MSNESFIEKPSRIIQKKEEECKKLFFQREKETHEALFVDFQTWGWIILHIMELQIQHHFKINL